MKWIFGFFIFFISLSSQAGLYGELNGYFSSDTFTTDTDSSDARNYFALDLLAPLDNKQRFYGGFHLHQMTINSERDSVPQEFSAMDMGPMVMWVLDRKRMFSVTVAYNIKSDATFSNDGTEAEWTGSSILASIGVMPEVSEDIYLGFRLNYYSGSFSKETIDGATTDVSHTRSWIFPTFSITWRK